MTYILQETNTVSHKVLPSPPMPVQLSPAVIVVMLPEKALHGYWVDLPVIAYLLYCLKYECL